jgi:broad specificity phosphatase PhoE
MQRWMDLTGGAKRWPNLILRHLSGESDQNNGAQISYNDRGTRVCRGNRHVKLSYIDIVHSSDLQRSRQRAVAGSSKHGSVPSDRAREGLRHQLNDVLC